MSSANIGSANRTSIDDTCYSSEGEIIKVGVRFRDNVRSNCIIVELEQLDIIKLREGRRVVVLTEREFRELTEEAAYCPNCEE